MLILCLIGGLYFVDQPYPQMPFHGVFNVDLRFGPDGGILGYANIGMWDRLGLGLSYGASNLIGYGDPDFYEKPGVQARLMAIEEGMFYPSIFLGFDNQGYGEYAERYDIRSKGLYGQISKSMAVWGVGIVASAGCNYCLESDAGFDAFCGIEARFGPSGGLILDYSLNLNDPTDQNKGYFNAGLRLFFDGQTYFEFAVRDLLDNNFNDQQFNRTVKLGVEQSF